MTPLLENILSDGIVCWRAWILYPFSKTARRTLALCMIGSFSLYFNLLMIFLVSGLKPFLGCSFSFGHFDNGNREHFESGSRQCDIRFQSRCFYPPSVHKHRSHFSCRVQILVGSTLIQGSSSCLITVLRP